MMENLAESREEAMQVTEEEEAAPSGVADTPEQDAGSDASETIPETTAEKAKETTAKNAAPASGHAAGEPEKPAPAQARKPRKDYVTPAYLIMNDLPEGVKLTNSRAGIKRKLILNTRVTQEYYYRSYALTSDGHFFLETVHPGILMRHKDPKSQTALGYVRQLEKMVTDNIAFQKEQLESEIAHIKATLENNGMDPEENQPVFTDPVTVDAIISSRLDRKTFAVYELADTMLGYAHIAKLLDIYNEAEVANMESSARQRLLSIFRFSARASRQGAITVRTKQMPYLLQPREQEAPKTDVAAGPVSDGGTV